MQLLILLSIAINSINGMLVRMTEPNIKIYDNTNLTINCFTEQSPEAQTPLSLSVRARMVLTFLTIPRGGQTHQVNGVLHCDPLRTRCESEFNMAASCITGPLKISGPVDKIESACQLVDELVCSFEWLAKHRGDCFALGNVLIIKGPKLGDQCITTKSNETIEQLLPCGEHQYCDTRYGICQCDDNYKPMNRRCVENYDSLNLFSSTTRSPALPTVSQNPTAKSGINNRNTSKALVIFLLIVAILLCIALAVVVIWRCK